MAGKKDESNKKSFGLFDDPFDMNHDGKLDANEIMLAYEEYERWLKKKENSK